VSQRKPDKEVFFEPGPNDWEVTCRGRYSGGVSTRPDMTLAAGKVTPAIRRDASRIPAQGDLWAIVLLEELWYDPVRSVTPFP